MATNREKLKLPAAHKSFILLVLLISCVSCSQNKTQNANAPQIKPESAETRAAKLVRYKKVIEPFFEPMRVREGDWLETFQEDGQTFEEYIAQNPTLPTAERNIIYIQPVGEFTETQRRILQMTAEYMSAFYKLPVKLAKAQPLGEIPKNFERKNPFDGQRQLKTSYFIDKLLPVMLPADAAALICFTNFDLFPDETFNYVFGQANLERRIGVWSLWRFGDPDLSAEDFRIFLERTLKIGMHETGHMFTMRHCVKYECLMSGSNHSAETDRRPLDVCPECMLKISWAMNYDAVKRYENLASFCEKYGLYQERKTFLAKADAILEFFE